MKSYAFIALAGVMVLSACAQTPMGSTVQVISSRSRPWQTKRKGLIFAGSVRRR